MRIVTYLINLDESHERLQRMSVQLERMGVAFERVSAFDGRCLDPLSVHVYDQAHALLYMGRALTGGELGCYLSHLECARRLLNSDADYAVVLEDDVRIEPNAYAVIDRVLDWLARERRVWYLMHIGSAKKKLSTELTHISGHTLLQAHYFPITTNGLIWSKKGAQNFVDKHQSIFAPIDNYLRFWLVRNEQGMSIWPPLVTPIHGVHSDIDAQVHRTTMGRSRLYSLIKQRRLWGDKLRAIAHKYF